MKKYVDISGFNINYANRGNSALSYGTINFLLQKGLLKKGQELVKYIPYKNYLKLSHYFPQKEEVLIMNEKWVINYVPVFIVERFLLLKWHIVLPFTVFGRFVHQTEYEAADYGGDGFSDIYGDTLFMSRLSQTFLLKNAKVPLILLPMTIGPFKKDYNYRIAKEILLYASKIYVRDDRYVDQLKDIGVEFEQEKDLSAYMIPEEWDFHAEKNSVGINVSGLAYSNRFPNLEGQFDSYPELIDSLICHFLNIGCHVYLIPHSYNFYHPEENNDDMVACRMAYERQKGNRNVTLLDMDLTSPRVKYVISQMFFFIGTRMHANFAAIFTNTPVFGLAYSYKFEGAFLANGIDPIEHTQMINYLPSNKIDDVIRKIDLCYNKYQSK